MKRNNLRQKDIMRLLTETYKDGSPKASIVYMIDETVLSGDPLKSNGIRYFQFNKLDELGNVCRDKKNRLIKEKYHIFWQVAVPFIRYGGIEKKRKDGPTYMSYHHQSLLPLVKKLGFRGFRRINYKAFGNFRPEDQRDFVRAIRELIGNEIPIYADARPQSKICAKKYPATRLTIMPKEVTQRVDAVFGCKEKIYKKLKTDHVDRNGKKYRRKIKGLTREMCLEEYNKMWDGMGIRTI